MKLGNLNISYQFLVVDLLLLDALQLVAQPLVAADGELVRAMSSHIFKLVRSLTALLQTPDLLVSVLNGLLEVLCSDQILSILEMQVGDVVVTHSGSFQVQLTLIHETLSG